MNDIQLVASEFQRCFNRKLKSFEKVSVFFKDEEDYLRYFKKVLYFTSDVIEPLQKKGMNQEDSIIDIASGDGQMSFALSLLGYRDITLFDLDPERLKKSHDLMKLYCPEVCPKYMNDSAVNLNSNFDVLISYQTIEHLSDEGNYSIAKKKCQVDFLERVNKNINKLCYFNAPNRTFPIDGHDTGKPFFHFLPINWKKNLIEKRVVKCSWSGISRPVSIGFLNKHLTGFHLASSYYAFDSMVEYLNNRPAFDYIGNRILSVDTERLKWKKKVIKHISGLLGKNTQNLLPSLGVIYMSNEASVIKHPASHQMGTVEEYPALVAEG